MRPGQRIRFAAAQRAGALTLISAAAALALSCGTASASMHRLASFGSFADVQGVAVDSSTGDVYVYDAGAESILKFDAGGAPADFSATSTNAIAGVGGVAYGAAEAELAVDNSNGPAKGDIYLAHGGTGGVLVFDEAGEQIGEITEELGTPWGETCGVAVDASGAVYVGIYEGYVNKYVPTGNPVTDSNYASSLSGLEKICNLAADSAANIFTATYSSGPITRYEASEFGAPFAAGANVDTSGSSLAVDSGDDHLYVDETDGVSEFGAHGEPYEAPLETFGSSGAAAISGSYGIAVSAYNGYIYVSSGTGQIAVFANVVFPEVTTSPASGVEAGAATLNGQVNPNGVAVTGCSFEYGPTSSYGQSVPCEETVGEGSSPVAVHAAVSGLTPGANYHFRLVAANENGSEAGADESFGTPGPPAVSDETASQLRATSALLRAQIDPGNLPTSYDVEYGTTSSYGQTTASAPVGEDGVAHRASVSLQGLAPGTTYHFRFVATNSAGTAPGPDETFSTGAPAASPCANEALRTDLSSRLPDCRAYEQVSPREKNGAATRSLLVPQGLLFKAAADGQEMSYVATNAVAGSPAGGQTYYLASRGSQWVSEPLSPANVLPVAPPSGPFGVTGEYLWLSEDLSCQIVRSSEPLSADTPEADIAKEVRNLYRRNPDGTFTLLTDEVPETLPSNPVVSSVYTVLGATPDCKRVVFQSDYGFLPGAPQGSVYEWDEGTLRIADVLPNGSTATNLAGWGPETDSSRGILSSDANRFFFAADEQIFLREDNGSSSARTVEVSASQTAIPANGARFEAASKDGAHAFFIANSGLTPGAAHPSEGCSPLGYRCDLYEYDAESERLYDLSPDANAADTEAAGVIGALDISEDGGTVYFAATGQLTPGSGQADENTQAENTADEEWNVYAASAGSLQFVGRVTFQDVFDFDTEHGGDNVDLTTDPANWSARATPDGEELLFTSRAPITGYDNVDAVTGRRDPEAFVFSVQTGQTVCISCDPSGTPPTYAHGPNGEPREKPIVPHDTAESGGVLGDVPRALSSDGDRVFFETADQLSPLAKSGEVNVYEWELAGAGSCTAATASYEAESGGCVYLLDSGSPANQFVAPAAFVDASANGDDVFLQSSSKLVAGDTDSAEDVYDVRVDGGIPEAAGERPCEGEACQGLAAGTPTFPTPPSAAFSGAGDEGAASGKPGAQNRRRELARALRSCRRKKLRRKRRACMRSARKRYGKPARKARRRRHPKKRHTSLNRETKGSPRGRTR